MYKINIPNILLKQKIYVPMMTPKLKLEESQMYEDINSRSDRLTFPINEKYCRVHDKDPSYLTDKKLFNRQ